MSVALAVALAVASVASVDSASAMEHGKLFLKGNIKWTQQMKYIKTKYENEKYENDIPCPFVLSIRFLASPVLQLVHLARPGQKHLLPLM